ncbi:MAG: protein kinase [Polyangiales bacterium]
MSSSSREPGLRAGDTFGGYEVVRRIGAGGFGAVYEAVKLPLRKRCALKVLHREHANEPDLLDRFLREAEIVAQLEHPHVVTVFDVGVHDEQPYIAMELLEGQSLADAVKRGGPMRPSEAVDLMLPVLSAMAVVHERGVVHRDLKPDNVFLSRPSTGGVVPKLLDFGIAKVRDASRPLTVTNAIMGTPSYMSPEQARESKYIDGQSDQWSLAVILFECLAGACPFQGQNLLEILVAITTGPTPRLRDGRPELPEALESVLLRAMAQTPEERFPSVAAFAEALLPFASDAARAQWSSHFAAPTSHADAARRSTLPGDATPPREETLAPATRSSNHPSPRAPWRRTALVGAVAVAAVIAGFVGLSPRAPTPRPSPVTVVRPLPRAPAPTPVVHAEAPVPVAAPTPAPAPTEAAPVIVESAPDTESAPTEATAPTRRRHRRHGHSRREAAAPSGGSEAFPNF